jgi:endonuclease/exonuclease/phosphatase family metal-dependent hydrolase
MTQNLYEGTNFIELASAQTPGAFVAAVTTTYNNILATKPLERAATLARRIARDKPDVVGLQEVSLLRTGTPGTPATTVKSDMLQGVMDELDRLGERYRIAGIIPGFDAQAPSTMGFDVRLTGQDAILVRHERGDDRFKVENHQVRHFIVNQVFPSAVGQFTITRGYASIDVTLRDRPFRFVTTHLDVTPAVQMAQAAELIAGAGNTSLPVIFTGDFNARADSGLDPTFPTYQAIINAGFTDAWRKRLPDPGYTCCQAQDLLNPSSLLNQRIDLILLRGGIGVSDIRVIAEKTPSGLWVSDHAGVIATLRIPRQHTAHQH